MTGARIFRFAGPLLAIASLGWCLFIGRHLWITPWIVHGIRGTTDSTGKIVTSLDEHSTRFEDISSPLPLIIPVLIAGVACAGSLLRLIGLAGAGTLLLFGFSIISGFTIGGAYLPAVVGFALAIACEVRFQSRNGHMPGAVSR